MTSRAPSKGPGRNRLLTHDQIGRAAFTLADREGPAALTINRLARDLGVSPMTLYGYAESKDAIVAMLPALLLADLPRVRAEEPWQGVLETVFLSIYRRFVEHRHVTQLIVNGAVFARAQAELIEAVLDCLELVGFSEADAFSLQRTLATYTLGFAFFAIAERTGSSPQSRTSSFDPAEFPRLAHASALLGAEVDEAQYLRGLHRILGGSEPTPTGEP